MHAKHFHPTIVSSLSRERAPGTLTLMRGDLASHRFKLNRKDTGRRAALPTDRDSMKQLLL